MQYSALNNLGLVKMVLGQWDEALKTLDRAMSLLAEIGWSFARFVTLQNRATCEIELGRLGDAIRHLELCYEKGGAVLEPVNRVNIRSYLFDAWLHVGALDRAKSMLEEARAMVDELGLSGEEEEVRLRESRWLVENGRWEEAAAGFARTEEEAVSQKAVAVELIARAHGVRARARAGLPPLEPCDVSRAGTNQPLAVLVRYLLADGASVRGPTAELEAEMAGVVELSAELGMLPLEQAAAARLGAVREALGDSEGARAALERAAAATDRLAASLPDDLREIFEARPDVLSLRQRLAPA
jgi:tetratricopeptide (TPR) repeat protein